MNEQIHSDFINDRLHADDVPAWLEFDAATVADQFENDLANERFQNRLSGEAKTAVKQRLMTVVQQRPKVISIFKRYAAVAAVLTAVSLSAWLYFFHQNAKNEKVTARVYKGDVMPGRTGAVLKLSNGSTIDLDSAKGVVANGFSKSGDRLSVTGSDIPYATLECPSGRTMSAELSDGTLVWLNAGSSVTFPTTFKSEQRVVKMTGEAYFEVAKDKKHPFIVETRTDKIEVLGTHFNIHAYADEAQVRTTLLEGKVKIGAKVLAPGEQYGNGLITRPDINRVMAWKNGLFSFSNQNLGEIMRQLARWYNVEVKYESRDAYNETFSGELERSLTLKQVLNFLEQSNVHFRIEEDKRIVILP